MIQKYRKADANVRGRARQDGRAAKFIRGEAPKRRPAFDLIAYTAALEVLG